MIQLDPAQPKPVPTLQAPRSGLLTIMAGSAGAQALMVLSTPVLTRMYSTSDLGVFAVFTAIVGIIAPVAGLRLEAAVGLPRRDQDAICVVWAAAAVTLAVGTLVTVVGLVAAEPVGRLFGVPGLAGQWALLVLAIAAASLFQIASTWMIRHRRYRTLGLRDLTTGAGQVVTQLGLGLAGLHSVGLALGFALGRLAGLVGMTGPVRSNRAELRPPSLPAIWATVRRYRRFPLVASASALLNTLGTHAPVLVVSSFFGPVVVGLLGLTIRVLSAPSALISSAAAQVFQGEATRAVRERSPQLTRLVRATAGRLALIGLLPTVVVVLAAPRLFGWVFGEQWAHAGNYAQVLSVGYLARFAVAAVSQTLLILEQQTHQLGWDGFRLVLTVGGPTLCVVSGGSALTALVVLAVAYVVAYAALLVTCLRAARRFDRSVRDAAVIVQTDVPAGRLA